MKHTREALTLTIVIPAYNEESHIAACLDSIAAQTVKPEAVIVVNNNSSDDTVRIAEGYDFVTVLNETRQGIVYARDRGFNHVRTDLIGRIDADTVLPKNWVAYVKHYFSSPASENTALTGLGYFHNVVFPSRGFWRVMLNVFAFRFNRFIIGHFILWGSNMAMWRSHWHTVRRGTCQDNAIHEDIDLAIHMNKIGVKIIFRPKLLVAVEMKRMFSNWTGLYGNMMMWPRTFKRHHNKRWVFGAIGAYFLIFMSVFLLLTNKPVFFVRRYVRLKKVN